MPKDLENNIQESIMFKQENDYVPSFRNLYDRIGIVLLQFKEKEQRNYYIENVNLFKL